MQGHVLQEGHEVGRATLHLLQALELAVLLLCVLGVGMGVRQWGAEKGPWASPLLFLWHFLMDPSWEDGVMMVSIL